MTTEKPTTMSDLPTEAEVLAIRNRALSDASADSDARRLLALLDSQAAEVAALNKDWCEVNGLAAVQDAFEEDMTLAQAVAAAIAEAEAVADDPTRAAWVAALRRARRLVIGGRLVSFLPPDLAAAVERLEAEADRIKAGGEFPR